MPVDVRDDDESSEWFVTTCARCGTERAWETLADSERAGWRYVSDELCCPDCTATVADDKPVSP
jgi:hypothetical protein